MRKFTIFGGGQSGPMVAPGLLQAGQKVRVVQNRTADRIANGKGPSCTKAIWGWTIGRASARRCGRWSMSPGRRRARRIRRWSSTCSPAPTNTSSFRRHRRRGFVRSWCSKVSPAAKHLAKLLEV